jgi:hypothetical protein
VTTEEFTIDNILNLIKDLIIKNSLLAIKEKDAEIKEKDNVIKRIQLQIVLQQMQHHKQ